MQVPLTRSVKLASNGQAARYLYHKGGELTRPKLEETSITFIKIETGSSKSIVMAPFFVPAPNSPPLRKHALSLSFYTRHIIRESNPGNERKGGILLDKFGEDEGGCEVATAWVERHLHNCNRERSNLWRLCGNWALRCSTHLGASACYTAEGFLVDRLWTGRNSRNLIRITAACCSLYFALDALLAAIERRNKMYLLSENCRGGHWLPSPDSLSLLRLLFYARAIPHLISSSSRRRSVWAHGFSPRQCLPSYKWERRFRISLVRWK